MEDRNWKTAFFIFALAIGLIFEVMKHMPSSDLSLWRHEDLHLSHATSEYNIRPKMSEARVEIHPAPLIAGMQTIPGGLKLALKKGKSTAHTFDAVKKKNAKDKKKKDDKKKKKKKDKKKKDKPKVADQDLRQNGDSQPKRNPSDVDAAVGDALQTGSLQAVPETQGNGLLSLDDWKRLLLAYPDVKETKLFIQKYNENLVSADVFYQIVQLMIEDPRTDMQKLGIMATSVTPSVLSFQLLASVANNGSSSTDVRQDARQALNNYKNVANLPILGKVMAASGDSYATYLAAFELQSAAQSALTQNRGSSTSHNPSAQQVSSHAALVGVFQSFVGILENLTHSSNSSINSQARQTLSLVQSLLNGQPVTPS